MREVPLTGKPGTNAPEAEKLRWVLEAVSQIGLASRIHEEGDVHGPASGASTNNAVVRWDGTTGNLIQDSGVIIDDTNNVSGVAALSTTSIELGHASDTTLSRLSAGDIAVEGNRIYRAGGTDVPIADGGTGASTQPAALSNLLPASLSAATDYTATSNDLNAFLTITGSIPRTINLPSLASAGSKYRLHVRNASSRRVQIDPNGSETIDGNGAGVAIDLYPGMACSVFANAGATAWYTVGLPARWLLTADLTLTVDTTFGSDANDGLGTGSGNALATIMAAYRIMHDRVDHGRLFNTLIQVADGTYAEEVQSFGHLVGSHVYTLKSINGPSNCIIAPTTNYAKCIYSKDYSAVQVDGFRLQAGGTAAAVFALHGGEHGIIHYKNCQFGLMFGSGGTSGRHISGEYGALVSPNGDNEITGNAAYHIVMEMGGRCPLGSFTTTIATSRAFTTFAIASDGGVIKNDGSAAYSGAGVATTTGTRYAVARTGGINTNGGGANYFPGDVAGTADAATYGYYI